MINNDVNSVQKYKIPLKPPNFSTKMFILEYTFISSGLSNHAVHHLVNHQSVYQQ